jgi:hypothetical protein
MVTEGASDGLRLRGYQPHYRELELVFRQIKRDGLRNAFSEPPQRINNSGLFDIPESLRRRRRRHIASTSHWIGTAQKATITVGR